MKKIIIITILISSLASCDKNEIISDFDSLVSNKDIEEQEMVFSGKMTPDEYIARRNLENSKAVYEYIKSLGIPENKIIDRGLSYLVDGDMVFSKYMKLDKPIPSENASEEQAYESPSQLIYNANAQKDIKIRLAPNLQQYRSHVMRAIRAWNTVAFSRIKFRLVTTGSADISIISTDLDFQAPAAAYLPQGDGKPGPYILINTYKLERQFVNLTLTFDEKADTIAAVFAHEMGHCIGFAHTNWRTDGTGDREIDIPGTPTADASSIMNSYLDDYPATKKFQCSLTPNDAKALRRMYPSKPVELKIQRFGGFATHQIQVTWKNPLHRIRYANVTLRFYRSNGTLIRTIQKSQVSELLLAEIPRNGPGCNCAANYATAEVRYRYLDNTESMTSDTALFFFNEITLKIFWFVKNMKSFRIVTVTQKLSFKEAVA